MWRGDFQQSPLREHLVLVAPELDPHKFVRRVLRDRSKRPPIVQSPRLDLHERRNRNAPVIGNSLLGNSSR